MSSFTKRVTAGVDDGYGPKNGSGSWSNAGNYVSLGKGTSALVSLFRFQDVTIPQGSIINSAKLTFYFSGGWNNSCQTNIYGIDEDNTASFSTDPRSRNKTSAVVTWDFSAAGFETYFDTSNISTVIKEIVDRGGWSSGNALGIRIEDDGSTYSHDVDAYDKNSATCALLTVDYTVVSPSSSVSASISLSPSLSPSASPSPSSSISLSPSPTPSESPSPSLSPSITPSSSPSLSPSSSISLSPSASPSASVSPSSSISASPSPSPEPLEFFGLKIAKKDIDAFKTNQPEYFKFHSNYGTLKYFDKQTLNVSFDADTGDITGRATYTHNLGYYPFVEVFTRVYIGAPSGNWEYCPFAGAGATIEYSANYKLTTTDITVYGEINGVSISVWNFEFLIFIYKNNLKLG